MCKCLGFFWLSRKFYKKNPRILCYHGFTLKDEHLFRPKLFIEEKTFDKRMKYLQDKNYNVISLDDFYKFKEENFFPDDVIVITIDDGFYSTLKIANEVLAKYHFPSTLYLTSYYCDKNCPIFMLAVGYMFYKAGDKNTSLHSLNVQGVTGNLSSKNLGRIIEYGSQLKTEQERVDLLKSLAKLLDIDYEDLNNSRILNLITFDEISELLNKGMDIQLHTHRHTFSENEEAAAEEIEIMSEMIETLPPINGYDYYVQKMKNQLLVVQGWQNHAKGDSENAISLLKQAAMQEAASENAPSNPGDILPAEEMLGDLYFELSKLGEAYDAYKLSLERSPGRYNSIYGAGITAYELGDMENAKKYFSLLVENAEGGNSKRETLNDARMKLASIN